MLTIFFLYVTVICFAVTVLTIEARKEGWWGWAVLTAIFAVAYFLGIHS